MLWNLEELRGYALRATDGSLGSVADVYFDDETWTVRWLVVDTAWLFGRRVLLPPSVLGHPDAGEREFPVDLSQEQVKNAPDVDTHQPVGRREESLVYGYYGWFPYWGGDAWGTPASDPGPVSARETHLRSGHDLIGYHMRETDDGMGEVEDLLIDENGWVIRYMIVDTGNWLPGRRVLISPRWANAVSWPDRHVSVGLTRRDVESSPEYDPAKPLDRSYEEQLHRHFRQTIYWE